MLPGHQTGLPSIHPRSLPTATCTTQAHRPFNFRPALSRLLCASFIYLWCRALVRLCYLTIFLYHFYLFWYLNGGLLRALQLSGWAFLPFCTFSGRSVVTLGPSPYLQQHLHPLGLLFASFLLVLLSTPWLLLRTLPLWVLLPPFRLSRLTLPQAASCPSALPTHSPHLGRPLCPWTPLNTGSSENPTSNTSPPERGQNKPNKILFVSYALSACNSHSGDYSLSVLQTHGTPS